MLQLGIKITGLVQMVLRDSNGNVKDRRTQHNLIVNEGLVYIADRMLNAPAITDMGWMAIGIDGTAASAGQTALQGGDAQRVALAAVTHPGGTYTTVYTATLVAGTAVEAQEAAIFNNAVEGHGSEIMLCRTVFATISKLVTDTLDMVWTLTFAAA